MRFEVLRFELFSNTKTVKVSKLTMSKLTIISNLIINLLKFIVLSSLRCLVPVRFSIIVTISSHYNITTTIRTIT